MTTSDIKEKIKKYIDGADDRVLNIFSAIIDAENEHSSWGDSVDDILEERLRYHKENPSDGKSWDEIKNSLTEKYGIQAPYGIGNEN